MPQASRAENALKKIKVVRIIGRLNVGGPARQACLLHESLPEDFERILITGTVDAGEEDMSYLLHSEAGVVRVSSMSRPVRFSADLAALWAIYRVLRRERPDIVHTHTAKAGTLGRIAAMLAGTKLRVHTFHGHVFSGYFSPAKTRLFLAIERWLARHTTQILTVSSGQATELVENYKVAPRERVRVMRNGFAWSAPEPDTRGKLRKELRIAEDAFLVLWCGRMAPIKGVERLAEVIRCAQQFSKIHFVVVGDGPEREIFAAATAGLGDFTWLGWRQDIPSLLAAADAALLTSLNEGTPTSLIEAMFAGKPWVATNVGGVAELAGTIVEATSGMQRGANGFVVETNSAEAIPARMFECLARLAEDKDLSQSMGARGRGFAAANYGHERLVEEMSALYRSLAGESHPKFKATGAGG